MVASQRRAKAVKSRPPSTRELFPRMPSGRVLCARRSGRLMLFTAVATEKWKGLDWPWTGTLREVPLMGS